VTYFKKHILPAFGDYYIDTITIQDCQLQVNRWYMDYPKSTQSYKIYAQMIFKYAQKLNLIEKNPMSLVDLPKSDDFKDDKLKYYDRDTLIRFLKYIEPFKEVYTFFYLLSYTGLRCGEAFALTWNDIDFKKLYHMGYRGVLFDIDNTLTEHGAPATASVIHFFENLRTIGFTTCLVSNNKAPRILPFAKEVNSYYVCIFLVST